MMNSKYMRYANEIDKYLINRPRQVVNHCLLKKNLEENLDSTSIKMHGVGKFSIQYFSNGIQKFHSLDFGDDDNMPSCTCYSWKSSALSAFFLLFFKNFQRGTGMPYHPYIEIHHI